MADDNSTAQDDQAKLTVPADIQEKFGDLITLIKSSRSMDDSERQYWVDVLPIMSEDQIDNLRGILDNEKKQLKEAESTYSKDMDKAVQNVANEFDEEAYLEKKRARMEAEMQHEEEEAAREAAILEEINSL